MSFYEGRKEREREHKRQELESDLEIDAMMHEIYSDYRIVDYSHDMRCCDRSAKAMASIAGEQKWYADFLPLSYIVMQYYGADFDMGQCVRSLYYHMGIAGEFCSNKELEEKYDADFCGFLHTAAELVNGLINAKGRVVMRDDGAVNVFFVIGARKA